MHLFLFSVPGLYHQWLWLILPVFVGLVAGLLSQMILPGRGFGLFASFVLGIAGAWLGGKFIISHLGFIENLLVRKIVSATAGAIVLAFIVNVIRGGKDRDKTAWRHN